MKGKDKILHWLPRILSILFIAFISMFALDVFGEPNWFPALLIHLIPSFIFVALTIFAWKNERLGGFAFIGSGILLMIFTNFEAAILYVPIFVIAALYLIKRPHK